MTQVNFNLALYFLLLQMKFNLLRSFPLHTTEVLHCFDSPSHSHMRHLLFLAFLFWIDILFFNWKCRPELFFCFGLFQPFFWVWGCLHLFLLNSGFCLWITQRVFWRVFKNFYGLLVGQQMESKGYWFHQLSKGLCYFPFFMQPLLIVKQMKPTSTTCPFVIVCYSNICRMLVYRKSAT